MISKYLCEAFLLTLLMVHVVHGDCGGQGLCQEMLDIMSSDPTVKHRMFRAGDSSYARLEHISSNCSYKYLRVECHSFSDKLSFTIFEKTPGVIVLKENVVNISPQLNALVPHTESDAIIIPVIDKQPPQVRDISMNSTSNLPSSPRWLKVANAVMQVIYIILLFINAAVLNCILKKDEPIFGHLYFILSLSLGSVMCCHIIWYSDNRISIEHLLLSIAEHYLWCVCSLACLTANASCLKEMTHRHCNQSESLIKQVNQNSHGMADSLADQYLVIFVIPLLYMAPLPFLENTIHKNGSFRMVPLLTHLYTDGHRSLHTMLVFVCPLTLVAILNIITIVSKVRRGISRRAGYIHVSLLLVSFQLPAMYVLMTLNKSPDSSLIQGVAILVLSPLLIFTVCAILKIYVIYFIQHMNIVYIRDASSDSSTS